MACHPVMVIRQVFIRDKSTECNMQLIIPVESNEMHLKLTLEQY